MRSAFLSIVVLLPGVGTALAASPPDPSKDAASKSASQSNPPTVRAVLLKTGTRCSLPTGPEGGSGVDISIQNFERSAGWTSTLEPLDKGYRLTLNHRTVGSLRVIIHVAPDGTVSFQPGVCDALPRLERLAKIAAGTDDTDQQLSQAQARLKQLSAAIETENASIKEEQSAIADAKRRHTRQRRRVVGALVYMDDYLLPIGEALIKESNDRIAASNKKVAEFVSERGQVMNQVAKLTDGAVGGELKKLPAAVLAAVNPIILTFETSAGLKRTTLGTIQLAFLDQPVGDKVAAEKEPPFRAGDLFPKVRPVYIAPGAASKREILLPLATPQEEQSFRAAYGTLLQDAEKGSAEDKASTAELFRRRAAAKSSAGEKRLLLLAAFNLDRQANVTPAELAASAKALLEALEGSTLALAAKRANILAEMNRVLPQDARYSASAIADEILSLSEMRYNAGMLKEAAEALDTATLWANRDAAYAARMRPRIDAFKAALDRVSRLENTLAANPDDPEANTIKGLALLGEPRNLRDAAPFLAKSAKPELRALAKAIATDKAPLEARIDIAAAASDALNVTTGQDQQPIAHLLFTTTTAVLADAKATETQKARAELQMIKAEKLIGKEKLEEAALPPAIKAVQFFAVQSAGKRVVFILDHSGSMLDNFDFLRQEAVKSVNRMEDDQLFNAIMVSERASAVFKTLQPASARGKKDFAAALTGFRAQGSNDDMLAPFKDAFEKAFAMNPEIIYFLTDGHFDPRLSREVEKLNTDKKVHVNALAFVNREPSYEEQLKQLAKSNGGTYKFVSERDLGK